MFDKLLNEIKELERIGQIAIPIDSDEDGYFDRECPNEECLFQFKVDEQDWKDLFKDEVIYCPLCRHEAPSKSWWTKEQLDQSKEEAIKHIIGRLDNALVQGAKDF